MLDCKAFNTYAISSLGLNHTYSSSFLPTYLPTYLHSYLLIYLPTYLSTYLPTHEAFLFTKLKLSQYKDNQMYGTLHRRVDTTNAIIGGDNG